MASAISRVQAALAIGVLIIAAIAAVNFVYSPIGSPSPTLSTLVRHTFSASSHSSTVATYSRSSTSASAGESIWPTYHADYWRDGVDSMDPAISAQRQVSSAWNSSKPDGKAYAELLVGEGMLFTATENDSVYGLNATDGRTVWRTNLGAPVPGSSLPCGDIDPSGITGTPAIDSATGTLYVVAFLQPGVHELFGLSASDGAVVFEHIADPPGADVSVQQQRGALAFLNGVVYVPYGGLDGDCGDYRGWIVGVETNSTRSPLLSYVVPTQWEAGIWSTSGLAIDDSENIYASTGNSASQTSYDYGEAVIKFSSKLTVESYFAPTNCRGYLITFEIFPAREMLMMMKKNLSSPAQHTSSTRTGGEIYGVAL